MPKLGAEEERRKQTIKATLQVMAETGLENVTFDRIAAKAGFSKGIISYYFQNKKTVLLESCRALYNTYIDYDDFPEMNSLTAMEILAFLLKRIFPETPEDMPFGLTVDEYHSVMIQFFSLAKQDSDFLPLSREMYLRYYQGILQIIDKGLETGEFKLNKHTREDTAVGIMGILEGFLLFDLYGLSFTPTQNLRSLSINIIREWLQ